MTTPTSGDAAIDAAAEEPDDDPQDLGTPASGAAGGGGDASADEQGEELVELPSGEGLYLEGTEGWVTLEVIDRRSGSALERWFWAEAQLYEHAGAFVDFGEILDPAEGIDDCSVAQPSGSGAGNVPLFRTVGEAVLIDEGERIPFQQEGLGSFRNYIDLTALGREPRFGGRYGFEASGGTLPEPIAVSRIVLPQALSIAEFEDMRTMPRREQPLTWTGGGDGVLELMLTVWTRMADSREPSESYEILCRLQDDGAFTLPASVFDAVPGNGLIRIVVRRQTRAVANPDDHGILVIGEVRTEQELAFGEICDRPEVVAACERYADAVTAEYVRCGEEEQLPPREWLCPDYLVESCVACPEFFECRRETTRCEGGTVVGGSDCACP